MGRLLRLSLTAALLLTLFGPLQPRTAAQSPEVAQNTAPVTATQPEIVREPLPVPELPAPEPEDVQPVTFTAEEVERLTALRTASESRYGPSRTEPELGIPTHAYSPFDQPEPEPACSGAGCDHMPGVVLVKLAPGVQAVSPGVPMAASAGALTDSDTLNTALTSVGAIALSPVFAGATPPEVGAMVESPDGSMVDVPDLTRWYRADLVAVDGRAEADLTGAIESLSALDQVVWAEPDYVRRPIGTLEEPQVSEAQLEQATTDVATPQAEFNDPRYPDQWHLLGANVPAAWDYLVANGKPAGGSDTVVVAVIDTGVDYTHPDLAANMWVNAAEFNGVTGVDDDRNGYVDDIHGATTVTGGRSGNPQDDHGHGTHVAGIVAAQANNGIGGVGVAYNAKIMAIKAARYDGTLTASDIAAGIYYAVSQSADVINMSFGGTALGLAESDALAVAFGQAVLVAAAGNSGLPNENPGYVCGPGLASVPMYPASLNWVLGVMASKADSIGPTGWRAAFSNFDCIAHNTIEYELMAPGTGIWSTLPGNQYAPWSGTSMASPVVAGIAALARTNWTDKDVYSSRFIMGQIASNALGGAGGRADALASLSQAPEPELSYLQHWMFDTALQSPSNDGDGILDAGETVDLAIVIRNQWGKADNVSVAIEARNGVGLEPDPYVTMITSTVDYGAVGSFNQDDNGLIYENGLVVGAVHPFRFAVSPDCPNDHSIVMRLTMTADNGYYPEDPNAPYDFVSDFRLMVQRGIELPNIISENMTLSSDKYWIMPDKTLLASGVTVNVTPGTQIQFLPATAPGPYEYPPVSLLQVEGTLQIQGTAESPVELFMGSVYQAKGVVINVQSGGRADIAYARVQNPAFSGFATVDHCDFRATDSYVDDRTNGYGYGAAMVSNTAIHGIVHELGQQYLPLVPLDTVLYECRKWAGAYLRNGSYQINNTVFLCGGGSAGNWAPPPAYLPTFVRGILPMEYGGKTYFVVPGAQMLPEAAVAFAERLGGTLAIVDDAAESNFLFNYLHNYVAAFRTDYPDLSCGANTCESRYQPYGLIGLTNNGGGSAFKWVDGTTPGFVNWCSNPGINPALPQWAMIVPSTGCWTTQNPPVTGTTWIIEVPGSLDQADLDAARVDFVANGLWARIRGNAFLSPWWNPNMSTWMRFSASTGTVGVDDRDSVYDLGGNFWGGASDALIAAAIYDNVDDFSRPRIKFLPRLEIPAASTYPFVVDVLLTTSSLDHASTITAAAPIVGSEAVIFDIIFNRNMDPSMQPFVSFGPDTPLTDYTVHPIDGGWVNPRTWRGTFNVNPVTGDGYQLVRVAGPARAADDPWLVIGTDAGRFRFEVVTSGTEAMALQAYGQEGSVHLSWTQDDFLELSGYRLYRSNSENGTYSRIAGPIISNKYWDDTTVVPGQPYYYKFTVVKSDMTESGYSNIATGAALDTVSPSVSHLPVSSASPGLSLTIAADATDNVAVTAVTLYYRARGATPYAARAMTKTTGNRYTATLEGSLVTAPGLEYYIEATDGVSQPTRSGSSTSPHVILVENRPVVTGVTPSSGPIAGGTSVTISGGNFVDGAAIYFDEVAATSVVWRSSSQITCVTPAYYPTVADVRVVNPDAQSGTLLQAYTYESETASLSLPHTGGAQYASVQVPVYAADVQGLYAADLRISYDSTVLTARGALVGSLTTGWTLLANVSTPGQVSLGMFSSLDPADGTGVLAYLQFDIVGAPGSSSVLGLTEALLNGGGITVETANGSFEVDQVYDVSGTVRYWKDNTGISGATVTLGGVRTYSGESAATGEYVVAGAAGGDYSLVPEKLDEVKGISAYDASLALQHAVGLRVLTGQEFTAANVYPDGAVNSFDALRIAQRTVGVIQSFPGWLAPWTFVPTSRSIVELASNQTGQNFIGVLLGDVSGNWASAVAGMASQAESIRTQAVVGTLTAHDVSANPGAQVTVPVSLVVTEGQLQAIDMVITYDAQVLTFVSADFGTLTATGWGKVVNGSIAGKLVIALYAATPISDSGDVIRLNFNATGSNGDASVIGFQDAFLDEGFALTVAGLVTLADPTAVPADAAFSGLPLTGSAPLKVQFTNLSLGDCTLYVWDFGDGATSTDENPVHTYYSPGVYTVTLTVFGLVGHDQEVLTQYITVGPPDEAPAYQLFVPLLSR